MFEVASLGCGTTARKGLVYDVTNTYLYGKKCPIAKMGHDKEKVKGRPLIQIALAVTQDKGLPLFHKVFDGNIHDARTLQDMATTMKKYKIKSGLIIYDRGITSAENIDVSNNLHWDTLCGVPIKDKLKEKLYPIIKKKFICIDNWVQCNKTVFHVKIIPYKLGSVKGMLAICFNKQKENDLHNSRYAEIKNAEKLLEQGKKIKTGLEIYFDKDVVEKAFRCIKGITQLRPIRHWLYNRVIAHVMICYLSYTILIVLKEHLKKLNLSPEKALQHLDSMYKVYMRDKKKKFKISRIVTLTKVQKDILRAIDKKLLNPGG